MKSIVVICIGCLLIANIGGLTAGSPKEVNADKYGIAESASVEILSKQKQEDGKVTFKCRFRNFGGDKYFMYAKILKNDSLLHVAKSGLKFRLDNGDSVVLIPERGASCCSTWADGRWYNISFKLNVSDVDKLKNSEIRSVVIPFLDGEIVREIQPVKARAIIERLQSVSRN